MLTDNDKRRFFAKIGPPDENGCIPWLAATRGLGYGAFRLNNKSPYAHRVVAYMEGMIDNLHPIKPTDSNLILHSCDNPRCCNPKHLRVGDLAENMKDKVARNRQSHTHGLELSHTKLSPEDVREIRRIRAEKGARVVELAEKYKVSISQIYRIINKENQHFVE